MKSSVCINVKIHALVVTCLWMLIVAASGRCQTNTESLLIPVPQDLSIYHIPSAKLSERDIWTIHIHGIRLTALDPTVWSPLRIDRTDNRHLIPIRRFFLRESEKPGFQLVSIAAQFRFKPVSEKSMEKFPHERDPVFEIGFGARYSNPDLSNNPPLDNGYALRLSGFGPVRSGLFRYSNSHYEALPNTELPILDTKANYQLLIEFVDDKIRIKLDGKDVASYTANNPAFGLMSLQASWHPVLIDNLEIRAKLDGPKRDVILSGLVKAPEFERKKR
jgi:hypothetical protein